MMVLLLLASLVSAADDFVFTKQVNPDRLQEELNQAGCAVRSINGAEGKQWISFDGDGGACDVAGVIAAHVYVNPAAVKAAADSELADLLAKLKARKATADDKDRILELLLEGR